MSGITTGRLRTLMGVVLAGLLLTLTYGCGDKKGASDAKEGGAATNEATTSTGDEKKDAGSEAATSSGGGDASSSLPADVPVYPGAKKDQEAKVGNQTLVSYTSADAVDAIHAFYSKEVPGAGWTVAADVNAAGAGATISAAKDGWNLAVAIAPNPTGGGSLISVTCSK